MTNAAAAAAASYSIHSYVIILFERNSGRTNREFLKTLDRPNKYLKFASVEMGSAIFYLTNDGTYAICNDKGSAASTGQARGGREFGWLLRFSSRLIS